MRLSPGVIVAGGLLLLSPVSRAADPVRTGITVAPPKVFDNRSLVIMLEQLERQLQTINVVESQKDKLLAALSTFQGARITDVAQALSVTGPALPKVTTKETPDEAGELQLAERNTEQAAATASAPAAPQLPSALAMSPSFGVQAEDVLSDQVNLTYQIMNVRMLLDRALSDRLYNGQERVQVVLGFQIGIDPPKEAKDKAAFVEITVTDTSKKPVSLVSVLPYEKTYNAFAIDRKSNAFGGAAISKIINVGYTQQRRSETLYVYKDADTLAIGNPALVDETDAVTFGWQFRPVLGRRSVSPGLRQLFAVIALPHADNADPTALTPLQVSVRTYWRKYDSRKATTAGKIENGAAASLGSVQPLKSDVIGTQLSPRVHAVEWRATSAKTALVRITGANLFSGTQVLLGPKVHDSAATGLILKSDHAIELRTTLADLAFGDAAISGRYGPPIKLAAELDGSGIAINSVSHRDEPGRSFVPVDVVLQSRDGGALTLPPEQPIMTVGTEVATSVQVQHQTCTATPTRTSPSALALSRPMDAIGPGPERPPAASSTPPPPPPQVACWRVTGLVPREHLHKEPTVAVRFPFRGDRWQAEFPIYEPFAILGVTALGTFDSTAQGQKQKVTRLAITGRGFDPYWSLVLDREYVCAVRAPNAPPRPDVSCRDAALKIQDGLIQLDVPNATLASFKHLIVRPEFANPIVVKLPDGKPAPLEPSIEDGQKVSATKETSAPVVVKGKDLKGIVGAKFEGKPLVIKVGDDGKTLTVFLTRDVTAKAGTATILLETADGFIPVTIAIQP
jgi:hypothetical protein